MRVRLHLLRLHLLRLHLLALEGERSLQAHLGDALLLLGRDRCLPLRAAWGRSSGAAQTIRTATATATAHHSAAHHSAAQTIHTATATATAKPAAAGATAAGRRRSVRGRQARFLL